MTSRHGPGASLTNAWQWQPGLRTSSFFSAAAISYTGHMGPGGNNLVFEVLTDARLIVSCQTSVVPTDDEWDGWLAATTRLMLKYDGCRLLVLSDRGHPTGAQIERLRQTGKTIRASGRSEPPTAIISPSSAMRLFVNALTAINPRIRCYAPEDREKAFGHIKLTHIERAAAIAAIDRLQHQLASSRAKPHAVDR